MSAGTAFQDAELVMEPVKIVVFCEKCNCERELPDIGSLRCPVCNSTTPKIVRGRELELMSLEVS